MDAASELDGLREAIKHERERREAQERCIQELRWDVESEKRLRELNSTMLEDFEDRVQTLNSTLLERVHTLLEGLEERTRTRSSSMCEQAALDAYLVPARSRLQSDEFTESDGALAEDFDGSWTKATIVDQKIKWPSGKETDFLITSPT